MLAGVPQQHLLLLGAAKSSLCNPEGPKGCTCQAPGPLRLVSEQPLLLPQLG